MSVQSEIDRIKGNVAATYAEVLGKGGTLPEEQTSDHLAKAVGSIPQTLDNNPVGTVISFMGTTAPNRYLVCDGGGYSISDYPDLAAFFAEQFGEANHFGGDGMTTFAVPDMRNLFLRGYHGDAEEQLSGEVGEKQDATTHPGVVSANSGNEIRIIAATNDVAPSNSDPQNIDKIEIQGTRQLIVKSASFGEITSTTRPYSYTSRPLNMAVLYCIKAVKSVPWEEAYSTEETRVGLWIDMKPRYKKVILGQAGPDHYIDLSDLEIETVISIRGMLTHTASNVKIPLCDYSPTETSRFGVCIRGNILEIEPYMQLFYNDPVHVILEYTKTTDSPIQISN